jgi:riboflavin synthase
VDVSFESLAASTLGDRGRGRHVHLERALRLSDRLGGHLVTGHVDGIASLRERRQRGDFIELIVKAPEVCLPFLAAKGSVALDGVSLTVNDVRGDTFTVAVIPHTLASTTLDAWRPGRKINLETDLVAKYVHRLNERREAPRRIEEWLGGSPGEREDR